METKIYNQKGQEAGTFTLPENIFGLKWNADLVHQVVTSITANTRAGTADTKRRGEVRGGGKKPWKQKGTGQARHGSIRSPIWKGGGVTHGPLSEKNYKKKLNKKMKTKALYTVLSEKLRDGKILFVDQFGMKDIKTKNGAAMVNAFSKIKGFEKLGYKGKKARAFVALPAINEVVSKSMRNLPQIELGLVKDINPVDILSHKYLIMLDPKETVALLAKRGSKKE